jgi:hypothetical protein
MRAEDRRTISCWRLAVALPHSAISPSVRPQPVQTLEPVSSEQISLQGDGGLTIICPLNHPIFHTARSPLVARDITRCGPNCPMFWRESCGFLKVSFSGQTNTKADVGVSSPPVSAESDPMHLGLVRYFLVTDQTSQRHRSCMPLPERMSCSYFSILRARVSDFLAAEKCRR